MIRMSLPQRWPRRSFSKRRLENAAGPSRAPPHLDPNAEYANTIPRRRRRWEALGSDLSIKHFSGATELSQSQVRNSQHRRLLQSLIKPQRTRPRRCPLLHLRFSRPPAFVIPRGRPQSQTSGCSGEKLPEAPRTPLYSISRAPPDLTAGNAC